MFLITPILIALLVSISINYSSPRTINVSRTEKLENRLDQCVNNILRHFCWRPLNYYCDAADLLTNVDLGEAKICRLNFDSRKLRLPINDHRPKIVLFDVRSTSHEDFIQYLDILGSKKWKRTVVYIVESINLEFLRNISYLLTENAFILDEKLNLHYLEAYVNGNASDTDFHLTNLGNCLSASTISNILPFKPLKKWPNTTIKIFYRYMPPYVHYEGDGVEQNILRIVLNHLGMKNVSRMDKATYQGEKNHTTGNYSNTALLHLQYNQVDVVVGAFHASDQIYDDFDGSLVYAVDTLNIIAPKSGRKPIWLRVLNIFTPKYCMLSMACLFLLIIFLHYAYNKPIHIILMWPIQIMTDSPIYNFQKKCNFRLLMSTILIFSLVDSTAFKSALEMVYFSKEYEKEIHTEKDAEESGLTLYGLNTKSFWHSMKICPDIVECLDRVAFIKDSIMVFTKIPVLFSLPKYYTDINSSEPLLYIGKDLELLLLQMIFQKNYPPFEDINHVLTRTFETGLHSYEANRKVWDWYIRQSRLKIFSSHLLSLEHLKFVFIIWAVGITLATLVFIGELIVHNYF